MSKAEVRLTVNVPKFFMNPVDYNVFDFTVTPRRKVYPLTAPLAGNRQSEHMAIKKRSNSWSEPTTSHRQF